MKKNESVTINKVANGWKVEFTYDQENNKNDFDYKNDEYFYLSKDEAFEAAKTFLAHLT